VVGAVHDRLREAAVAARAKDRQRHERDAARAVLASRSARDADLVVRRGADYAGAVRAVGVVPEQLQTAAVVGEVVAVTVVDVAVAVVIDAVATDLA